jgi:hypothetical protein
MSGWMDKMIVVCSGESGAIDEMSICGGERQRATVGPEMISNLTLWGDYFCYFSNSSYFISPTAGAIMRGLWECGWHQLQPEFY